MDGPSWIWDSHALGTNRQKFQCLHDGARLDSCPGYHDVPLFSSNISFVTRHMFDYRNMMFIAPWQLLVELGVAVMCGHLANANVKLLLHGWNLT